jgi:PAS domain S-box-containing protein
VKIASNRPSGEGAGSWSERRLAVLYETARSLAESATLDQAIPQILNAVCGALGWEYGALWDVDAKAGVLRCTATWSSIPLSFEFFATGSRDRTFIPGEGLPGRVWKSGAPAWIPDIRTDDNFPRAAAASRDGLHSALGFPLIADGATVGVMEFFSREIQQPDETLLDMLGAIGGQIGTFMKRRSAQDDLDRFFTLSLDMLCVATLEGYFIRVNPQWTAVTGFTADELLSRPYMEYVHPDDRPATLQAGARLAAGDAVASFANRWSGWRLPTSFSGSSTPRRATSRTAERPKTSFDATRARWSPPGRRRRRTPSACASWSRSSTRRGARRKTQRWPRGSSWPT